MNNLERFCRAAIRKHTLTFSKLKDVIDAGDLAYFLRVVNV